MTRYAKNEQGMMVVGGKLEWMVEKKLGVCDEADPGPTRADSAERPEPLKK
jgi:hypothetical protein